VKYSQPSRISASLATDIIVGSDEFGTVLIDEEASMAFFEDPWRLSEDILSNGAAECIKKLPDADRLNH
jgi:hypothetical protein